MQCNKQQVVFKGMIYPQLSEWMLSGNARSLCYPCSLCQLCPEACGVSSNSLVLSLPCIEPWDTSSTTLLQAGLSPGAIRSAVLRLPKCWLGRRSETFVHAMSDIDNTQGSSPEQPGGIPQGLAELAGLRLVEVR